MLHEERSILEKEISLREQVVKKKMLQEKSSPGTEYHKISRTLIPKEK